VTVTGRPAISVVVLSYQARSRIDRPLVSLRAQDLAEPYEVIVVDSGRDACADYVSAAYPEVRLVRSEHRLLPGGARNAGIRAARGPCVAFIADDMAARPDWLRRRLAKHRAGFLAVGGAVVNATPWHPVGAADYYLEYSSVIPSDRTLATQAIPHGLSYDRDLFDRLGFFPEDMVTGEDTLFNARLLRAGIAIGVDPGIRMAHANHVRLRGFLLHHYEHGRGLAQTVERDGLTREIGLRDPLAVRRAIRIFGIYPLVRWFLGLRSIGRGRPWALPEYLAVTPLLATGLLATATGAWTESRERARGQPRAGAPGRPAQHLESDAREVE